MRQLSDTQAQTLKLIEQAQKILCITHAKSGGDGVMSVLAAQQWLVSQGKTVKAVFPDQVPANFAFLPGLDDLASEFSRQGNLVISVAGADKNKKLDYSVGEDGDLSIVLPVDKKDVVMRQEAEKYDLILCFEVPELSALGEIYTDQIDFFQNTPLVNIAANSHNDFYAKFNLVDPTKSSVSEIIYSLMLAAEAEVSPELATALLTGIISGSDSFLGENTTASAFAVASKLQAVGAEQSDIIENLYKKKSLRTLKLWGQIFNRLEFDENHRICRSTLHKSDFEMFEATPAQIENLTRDILRFVDGSDVFVLFYDYDETISVQIRTADGHFNWATIVGDHEFLAAEGGIDLAFPGAHLSDIEKMIFTALIDYQVKTRGIDPSLVAGFKHCEPTDAMSQDGEKTEVVEVVVPKAPAHIPFEAPLQPHEASDASVKSASPTEEAKKDWIRKNFPKN